MGLYLLICLQIIISLSSGSNGLQSNSMSEVLEHVMKIKGWSDCDQLNVMSRNLSEVVYPQSFHHQKPNLVVTGDYMAKNRNTFTNFISSSVTCLTSIVWTQNAEIKDLAKVTKGLIDHTMYVVGDKSPKAKNLKAASGPVFWIEHVKPHVYRYNIYKFCPKEDRKLNSLEHILTWRNGSVLKANSDPDMILTCPGYLSNQDIMLGYIYRSRTVNLNGEKINAGDHTKLFLYLAEKLKFRPQLKLMDFVNQRSSFTKFIADMNRRKMSIGLGRFTQLFAKYTDVMNPHYWQIYYYVSRVPRPVETYYSLVLPFSKMVWNLIVVSLLGLAFMFYLTYSVYSSKHLGQEKLHKYENSYINFVIVTFCKITEPDAVPWFTKKWSTGRFLTCLWALYCFLLVSSYNCNLRAHLSAIIYEEKIDTVHDVINNGKRVWIQKEMNGNIQNVLKEAGTVDVPLYQVGGLASKFDGYYSLSEHSGIPVEAVEDMIANRAVAMLSKEYVSHQLRLEPKYKAALNGDNLYISREPAISLDANYIMRKQSPAREDVNAAIMLAVERGLVHKWLTEGYPAEAFITHSLPLVNEGTKMTMQHVAPATGFCLVGLIIGIIVFIGETHGLNMPWRIPKYKHTLNSFESRNTTKNGKFKLPPISDVALLPPPPKLAFKYSY